VPSLTPIAEEKFIKKPNTFTTCPEENHPLRLKQLFGMQFKPNKNYDSKSDGKMGRYECWGCCKTLNNAVKSIAISKCGHVICKTCADAIQNDKACPQCSKKFKEKHLIKIDTGTSYAGSSGTKLNVTQLSETAWV